MWVRGSRAIVSGVLQDSQSKWSFCVGLYENGDKYVYRGEVDNNYVSWNDKEFRIIGINADGTLRLLEGKGLERITWDDRYNEEALYEAGINNLNAIWLICLNDSLLTILLSFA